MVEPLASHASSGNLLADRRYAWGEAAAREGDHAAAADLFQQTVEIAPDWGPAWLALGEALARAGDREPAVAALRRAAQLDPSGALGATLRLAAFGAGPAPDFAAPDYVRALFDQYAPRFDAHLVDALAYRGPELLRDALRRACAGRGREFHFHRGLDLGCGTGLMAKALDSMVDRLDGVDLSPNMIAVARATGLYEKLLVSDVTAFFSRDDAGSRDLVVAADVFVYIGDLAPLFAACARALASGGLFAFTTQRSPDAGWRIGADLRYAHSADYVQTLARAHGFDVVELGEASTRKNAGVDIPGLVCVLGR